MQIQIQKSIKGSHFTDDVLWALKNCSRATKQSCDAELTRCDDEIEITLTAREVWGFTRSPMQDICKWLRNTRVRVLGVDCWDMTPRGLARCATITCTQWGAFEDIDFKESEVRQ